MAAALAERGIGKGDRVLVQSKNCNQMFESMFACFRLGAVWVPTNFRQTPMRSPIRRRRAAPPP
jgi:fatty-acyl-CoA synthase